MTRSDDSPKPDPDPPQSFAARLRRKYGEGVDPEVSLGGEPSDAPSGATEELLKRIAEHGVNSPRYTLEGEIARGGMGAILRVWDEELRRHLAMKVVLGQGEGGAPSAEAGGKGATPRVDARGRVETPRLDAKVLARFLEEAQVTSQLDHPGIVPVHELGLDADGRVYFTMKLVKGRDLKHVFDLVFEGKEGWNETRALGVILKACEAMAYAHKKGVIHRDLKPANVMVGSYGEVFVMDWGLARVLGRRDTHDIRIEAEGARTPGSLLTSVKTERREEREEAPDSPLVTMDGDVMGTPAYMPPEQARGEIEKLSQRSDVYSIGAMLYHLLAKQIPFVPPGTRMTNRTVLARVLEGPPKPLHEINKAVPAELVAICEKAMTRDAAGRYADTLALAEDLRAYLEHRVVAAYETGSVAELKKWIKRNKPLAAAMAGAAAILVAGVVTSMNFAGRASEKAAEAEKARTETAEKNTELEGINKLLAVAKHTAEQNEESAQQQSYVANIIAADASLRANEISEVRRRLDACDQNMRGWEWRYLDLAMDSSLAVVDQGDWSAFSDPLTGVSPDGSRIASVGPGHTVHVRSANSGENLLVLRGHNGTVQCITFSPDGSRIASTALDRTIRVWDATNGTQLLVLGGGVSSPRGDLETFCSVAFSPNGSRIASGSSDKTVRVWNATSGEALVVIRGHEGAVLSVAFSPDGSRIASASDDKTVRVWDATSGESLLVLRGHEKPVSRVGFRPDGSRITSRSSENQIRAWDAMGGDNPLVLRGHHAAVHSFAFSSDGLRIASASEDKTVRVWNATSGETLLVLHGHEEPVWSVAFSGDGSRIASVSSPFPWAQPPPSSAIPLGGQSPEDKTIRVWNATTGEGLLVLRGNGEKINSVAFSADGSRIASGSDDKTVRVWNATSGENLLILRGHQERVNSVVFNADGSRIVSGSDDKTVRVWNATSGENSLLLNGHGEPVSSVVFSPDGSRIASASLDRTVCVWNATSGERLIALRGHEESVLGVAFSPDGSRIASCSSDKTVRVWNASSGESLLVLRGHGAGVGSVAFSPDGSRIASASLNGTVRVWETSATEIHDASRQAAHAASSLVQLLFDRLLLVDDVIEYLKADPSLRDDVRSAAVRLAGMYEGNVEKLNQASWDVVSRSNGDPTTYMRALRMAQVMCDLVSKSEGRIVDTGGSLLNTLGVAQYRVGQYESSIATLTRSDALNHGEQPGDVAFLAMANHQLGNPEAARVALTRLRVLMQDSRWSEDAEAKRFAEEAETLLAGPSNSRPSNK